MSCLRVRLAEQAWIEIWNEAVQAELQTRIISTPGMADVDGTRSEVAPCEAVKEETAATSRGGDRRSWRRCGVFGNHHRWRERKVLGSKDRTAP